jgi:hypothetical protein
MRPSDERTSHGERIANRNNLFPYSRELINQLEKIRKKRGPKAAYKDEKDTLGQGARRIVEP